MLFFETDQPSAPTEAQLADRKHGEALKINCLSLLHQPFIQDQIISLITAKFIKLKIKENASLFSEISFSIPVTTQPIDNQVIFNGMDQLPSFTITFFDGAEFLLTPMYIKITESSVEYHLAVSQSELLGK
ncbi:hypothetical protein KBC89_02200 [Candidatus Woesebacteria bacterium]|nr:hypothetical protein [Candidatus Woesebacteria bacterium]